MLAIIGVLLILAAFQKEQIHNGTSVFFIITGLVLIVISYKIYAKRNSL